MPTLQKVPVPVNPMGSDDAPVPSAAKTVTPTTTSKKTKSNTAKPPKRSILSFFGAAGAKRSKTSSNSNSSSNNSNSTTPSASKKAKIASTISTAKTTATSSTSTTTTTFSSSTGPSACDPKKAALMEICLGKTLSKNLLPTFDKKDDDEAAGKENDAECNSDKKQQQQQQQQQGIEAKEQIESDASSPIGKSNNDLETEKETTLDEIMETSSEDENENATENEKETTCQSKDEQRGTTSTSEPLPPTADSNEIAEKAMEAAAKDEKEPTSKDEQPDASAASPTASSKAETSVGKEAPVKSFEPAEQKPVDEEQSKEVVGGQPSAAEDSSGPLTQSGDEEEAGTAKKSITKSSGPPSATKRTSKKTTKAQINAKTSSSNAVDPAELTVKYQAMIEKHETQRVKYRAMAQGLLQQVSELAAEQLDIPLPESGTLEPQGATCAFPNDAVPTLAILLEGSTLPLSSIVERATNELNRIYACTTFTHEMVQTKIPLVATRKQYIKNPGIATTNDKPAAVNADEDTCLEHLWRWELTVLDILPKESLAKVRQMRYARKKLATRFSAVAKYLMSLHQADTFILTGHKNLDKVLLRLAPEEGRILQFERDDEKIKLQAAKKEQQAAQVMARQAEKKRLREQAAEERKRQKEEQLAEKARKTAEAAAEKKRKQEEIEAKKAAESKAAQAKLAKQQNKLKSFFNKKATKKVAVSPEKQSPGPTPPSPQAEQAASPASCSGDDFDVEKFRSRLQQSEFKITPGALKLSKAERFARRRRIRHVDMNVFVTVIPDDQSPFGAQPYAESRTVRMRNRYKFLRFHEDVRPPYYGTWSKTSKNVTGRTPFGKEPEALDYEYDSEAEWEEGDDEVGEDLEEVDMAEDEEEDEDGDDEDGWLAADDEIDDDADEETKRQRQRAFASAARMDMDKEQVVSVISPLEGGVAIAKGKSSVGAALQGIAEPEAVDLLHSHAATVLHSVPLYLDAFPPELIDESSPEVPTSESSSSELSPEDKKTVARFIHLSTVSSRDKLVDELRSKHDKVTKSRAHAIRLIESIATKQRHPVKGIYWEVKADVLESLGLDDLLKAELGAMDTMRAVARFAHHKSGISKDRIVDEFMTVHASVVSSRAEGLRILDAVAEKKKHTSGLFWQVKESARIELSLFDLETNPPSASKRPLADAAEVGPNKKPNVAK